MGVFDILSDFFGSDSESDAEDARPNREPEANTTETEVDAAGTEANTTETGVDAAGTEANTTETEVDATETAVGDAEPAAGESAAEPIPVRGGLLLDGLLWTIRATSATDGQEAVGVEGPHCPHCGPVADLAVETVPLTADTVAVEGETGSDSVYAAVVDAPRGLPFEQLPIRSYVKSVFDGELSLDGLSCPLCGYTTVTPVVSGRSYRTHPGEEPPISLTGIDLTGIVTREVQRARETLAVDQSEGTTGSAEQNWNRYRSKRSSNAPYELVSLDGIESTETEAALELQAASAIEQLAAEATLEADTDPTSGSDADRQLPDDPVDRSHAIAAWLQQFTTAVETLHDGPLDDAERSRLRNELAAVHGAVAELDGDRLETLAAEGAIYVRAIVEGRARIAAAAKLLDTRQTVSTLRTGTENDDGSQQPGAVDVIDELEAWQHRYQQELPDFLTVERAIEQYAWATHWREQVETVLDRSAVFLGSNIVDSLTDDRNRLTEVMRFIETREAYNSRWIDEMTDRYKSELDSFFDDPGAEHNESQLQAIFRNDNYNRVNAAAGTGKTTTLGRRVYFLTTEYDEVAASDILAITFTKNGVNEMESELNETFGIRGVEVRTLNSYAKEVAEDLGPELHMLTGEARRSELEDIVERVFDAPRYETKFETFFEQWKRENYTPENSDVVDGLFNSHRSKESVTLLGEEISDTESTEEAVAHRAIADWLVRAEIDYRYKRYADWTELEGDTAYVVDFEIETDDPETELYVEYWPSEAGRESWPGFKAAGEPDPEEIRRQFAPGAGDDDATETDRQVIVIEGSDHIGDGSGLDLRTDRSRSRLRKAIRDDLVGKLDSVAAEVGLQPPAGLLDGEALKQQVYETYWLERKVVETVEDFIEQSRVREWGPSAAAEQLRSYTSDNEVGEAVEAFCWLCVGAYERFDDRFDNESLTDFHGTQEITRDRLRNDEVESEYLYDHILVDEMQDLNEVQFQMVKALADSRSDSRLFGVGDDWQSIFGFRGARPDLFIQFGERLGAGSVAGTELTADLFETSDDSPAAFEDTRIERNHRCPVPVVESSNSLVKNNAVRTDKQPTTTMEGPPIRVHHLACDTFGRDLNAAMKRKVLALIEASDSPPEEIRVLLRQRDGDSAFYYPLIEAVPDGVTVQTAHDSKGSEADHVIVPKVTGDGGYPSVTPEQWIYPIKRPPEIYEQEGVDYQIEEERRLFYVALTRSERRLDLLTVQGAESRFIDELPAEHLHHTSPFTTDEIDQLEAGSLRKTVSGIVVNKVDGSEYGTFDWDEGDQLNVNLWDAADAQQEQFAELAARNSRATLVNCGLEYRTRSHGDQEVERVQLQVDEETTIELENAD